MIAGNPRQLNVADPARWFVPSVLKWTLSALFALLVISSPFCNAQVQNKKEYKVKVAYIYKIAHYVNSAETQGLSTGDTLVIGILGQDPFGRLLDQIAAQRKIHSKTIVVKRFDKWAEYEPCDLLFVSKTATPQCAADAKRFAKGLLVGEKVGFAQTGGVFNMYLDDAGRVGIKLNIDAAKRRNFRVDARLLQICDVIRDPKKPN